MLPQPVVCPCAEPSGPEWRVKSTLGVLGQGMTRSHLFEHLIIQGSGFPLIYGTKIPTHDPGKVSKFRKVEPCPMRIYPLQITLMIEDVRNLCDLALLETQVCIVHFGKEILGMTTIGVTDTCLRFLPVSTVQIGNTEIVRQQRNMRVGGHEMF